jgi:hypothetical protein
MAKRSKTTAPDHEREAAEVLEELEREPMSDPLAEWSIAEGTLRALLLRVEERAREAALAGPHCVCSLIDPSDRPCLVCEAPEAG